MAGAGFCDSRPLLDLHQKVDERRALFQPWQCIDEYAEPRMAPLNLQAECRWDALHALVPTLLRCEVELSLQKLNLVWDHTYAWEMFLDMMRSQASYTFSNKDVLSNFTDGTRRILVDWLIKVHEMMHFQDETLYLAMHLLNRSLRLIKVTTANLQLLGMVCLFIAAKKEESLLPEVSDLCYVMDYTYTKQQLLRMERKVLNRLKFDLSFCAPVHFLLLFASVARCSAKMTWMARYLLELTLLEEQCVCFQPVQLAEAALCLARLVLKEPPTPEGEAAWCLVSSLHVGNESALLSIMHTLASAAVVAQEQTFASYIKFSSPETMHVSGHPGLTNASTLALLVSAGGGASARRVHLRFMMPKEQPCSDETSSTTSSKNAKDKSNSSVVQALHEPADANRRGCSEKDSGYSDTSSDFKHTNAKDRSNKKSREATDEFPLKQTEPHKKNSHGNAAVATSTGQLPSLYIIKNMVLEQPHIVQKNGHLLWANGAGANVQSSNPVLLLQPPNVLPPALQPQAPTLCKTTGKTDKPAYLPILNSYPRIAPHPNKKPPDKTSPNAENLNQSKRVCIGIDKGQANASPLIHKICASNSVTASNSASVTPNQLPTSSELNKTSVINTRHRRFANTVQVLKQSGLLDIALRTKELMFQSNVTGREVAQLRQHSDLLCQMASSSNQNASNMASWLNLHRLMSDSGSYPELRDVQGLQQPASPQNVSVIKPPSVNGEGDSEGSQSAAKNYEFSPKQMDGIKESKSEALVEKDARPDSLTKK
ncbi:hypothetical protein WMY93_029369 [Mugilogobius chulae]|uniref:Cyclin N-terminal domain-containing protein n=1 Tax=Mugilogobius chulae TaxID=88201 RepID=A0AAW0MUC9_9GOBI